MPVRYNGSKSMGTSGNNMSKRRRNKKSCKANDAGKQNRELAAMQHAILQDPNTKEWIGYKVGKKGVWNEACRMTYRWDVQEKFGI